MAVCRQCAAELPEGAHFCPACGTPVAVRAREERKIVTVLFADLVGSTALGDASDPEDVRAAIRPQLVRMRRQLELFGGTFEKFVGDAVMAVFGAPVTHEDDPERAVRAALSIRDEIPSVRCAVSTGEAVVTLDAAAGAAEGIATGDVVNTAFRLQEGAEAGSVVVEETTYRITLDAIEYGERRLLDAKGKEQPIAAYEALGANAEPRRQDEHPAAPLVGRRSELALIQETIAGAHRDRNVRLVTIVGVPGIGKSRLVWELRRALDREPGLITWRRGRCLPYGEGVTFWALGEMVKAHAGIVESDNATTAADKLRGSTADLVPETEAEWVETHMRPLVGLRVDDELEPSFAAWGRFFNALAERGPLVLAFEDLHWADDGLLDFIEHLADWLTNVPLVLLCTARQELYDRRPRWGARPNAAAVTLAPLSDQETSSLLGHLLRQPVLPVELQRALLERAEGNPLYAEELVRMLVERGDLRHVDMPLPQSVQGIVAARLDGLTPAQKTLLQDAAVVGRTFWPGALAAVRTESGAIVEQRLRELVRKDFVQHAGEGEYCFHHSLIRDIAYAQIPRAARAVKHVAVAAWLESLGRPDDHAETIAHHYLCALEFERASGGDGSSFAVAARRALHDAGQRALALHAHHAASHFFSAALELTEHADPERAELVYRAASSGLAAGEGTPSELADARDELLEAGELERGAELESMLGLLALDHGDQSSSLDHRRRAVELLRDSPPSRAKAYVLANLASQLLLAGEREEAIAAVETALEIAERLGLGELRARSLRTIGSARVANGDLGGVEDLERCVEIARELNSAEGVTGLVNLAATHLYIGNLSRSVELQAEGRRAAERFGDAVTARWLEIQRGGELYWGGRPSEALELLDRFIAEVEAGRPHYLEPPARVLRGRIRLAREQLAEALDDAESALESASRTRDIQVLYPALAFRARALLTAGQRSRAVPSVDELLARLDPADVLPGFLAWPDLASVLFDLGRGNELVEWAANVNSSRWLEAAKAHAGGELLHAAELYAEIGAAPEQAFVLRRAMEATSASSSAREH